MALLLILVGPAPSASAHVTISPSTTAAGAYAVLAVSVPHGCEGSPTTKVTIRIPDEIHSVTPTRNALWDVEKEVVELDPPVIDAHGNEVTERVAAVTYRTDEPLPEGYRDVFELSLQIPDAEGVTLIFPTIQTCERGESAWIEVAGEDQSEEELDLPAPDFVITAAEDEGGHDEQTGAEPTATVTADGSEEPRRTEEPEGTDLLGFGALGAGLLGVLLGGAALVRQRRRT